MARDRVCAALIKDDHILMVRVIEINRDFWTLPGGGVEEGETSEMAVIREVKEETNIGVIVDKQLFEIPYSHGIERCFLVKSIGNDEAKLGNDPELEMSEQVLQGIGWKPISEMYNDIQVSLVIKALETNQIVKGRL